MSFLDPRAWLAVVLVCAGCFAVGWKQGGNSVKQDWDADIAQRTTQALKAEQEARAKEQALQAAKQKVEVNYAAQKKRDAVALAGAQSELDRLRYELAPGNSQPTEATGTTARIDGAGRFERELLGHCATALAELAGQADRLETKVIGLQGYVRDVCTRD